MVPLSSAKRVLQRRSSELTTLLLVIVLIGLSYMYNATRVAMVVTVSQFDRGDEDGALGDGSSMSGPGPLGTSDLELARVERESWIEINSADEFDKEAKIEAKIDATIDAKLDATIDETIDKKLNAKLDARIDAMVDATIDATIDAKIDATVESKLDAAINAKIDAKIDEKLDTKFDPKINAKIDAKIDTKVNTEAEASIKRKSKGLRGNLKAETTEEAWSAFQLKWKGLELNRCEWIKSLLEKKKELALEEEIPGPGHKFYLKRPVLHTIDPVSGEEILILRYKRPMSRTVTSEQTKKFTNTVEVLLQEEAAQSKIFPRLFGFCPDIRGHHYLALEYIAYDVNRLPKPTSLQSCVERAGKALELFVALDEKLHMVLADFKAGQWMVRQNGNFVLQDVDDIVPSGSKSRYPLQVEDYQDKIRRMTHKSRFDVRKLWGTKLFPGGKLSIRYMILRTDVLLDKLGFRWSSDCNATPEFLECKKKLLEWTNVLDDSWPSPSQVLQALRSCQQFSTFDKTMREPAEWRDFSPIPASEWTPDTYCKRVYDHPEGEGNVTRCEASCCRSNGSNECYYSAPDEECDKLD